MSARQGERTEGIDTDDDSIEKAMKNGGIQGANQHYVILRKHLQQREVRLGQFGVALLNATKEEERSFKRETASLAPSSSSETHIRTSVLNFTVFSKELSPTRPKMAKFAYFPLRVIRRALR